MKDIQFHAYPKYQGNVIESNLSLNFSLSSKGWCSYSGVNIMPDVVMLVRQIN